MARRVLVDFDFLGEPLGLTIDGSSHSVELPDGSVRAFIPGAAVDGLPIRTAPIIDDVAVGGQTMSVTLTVAAKSVWAMRKAAPIQLATCRVYWWPEGDVLRDEHELFRGCVRNPNWTFGPDDASVSFTLSERRRIDDVAFPPHLVGDEGRFVDLPDDGKTSAVPVIYGTVYGVPLVAVSDPLVNPVEMVVAGHRIASTSLQLARAGVSLGGLRTIAYKFDGLGGFYAYVGVTPLEYADGADIYAERVDGWAENGRLVSQLGDVMEHAFRTYAQGSWYELDRPRIEAAKPILNRIAVGAFANERDDGTVMQFLEQRLGAQFPVAFSSAGGRFGWDALLFPRAGDQTFIVARITYGQDANERVGPVDTSADDVLTDIELTYGFDGYQAGTTRSIRFSPETSLDARRAMSRWGRAPQLSIDAPDVSDPDSAYLLLTDRALKQSRVRPRVEYHGLDERFYFLPLGGAVAVTDDDLGWTDEVCILESVEPREDGLVDVVLVGLEGY